ncbi:hypothetical protein [Curtobacterium pusillum]|uniref:Uncharacterized protein n=1 Tax=Curtobacterium pusillum TaxID=69373 RepID=A0ABX2M8B8_9MICO|nr:hypothetical protein [Curtobacterium pusillum]NUU13145.1 hypothetical protein [Curtobacterium pusillum]
MPDVTSAIAETQNPLIPVGWDIAGTVLSIVVTAAIIAVICLLVCTTKRRGRD